MGVGYEPRGRLQDLSLPNRGLEWFAIASSPVNQPGFTDKVGYEEVARVINANLDRADVRLRRPLFNERV